MGNVSDALKKHGVEKPAGAEPKQEAGKVAEALREASAAGVSGEAGRPECVEPVQTAILGQHPTNNYSKVLTAHHDRGSTLTEQYRALRTNLMAQYPNRRCCLMVTSAEAGEGKTVTTLNLGLVLAEQQECRTVVVDGDLRKARVGHYLHLKNHRGLAEVLRGEASLKEVVQPTVYPNLFVVPAGQTRPEAVGELFGRPELDEAVHELRREYDFVLIDTPPINVVSDAGMLGRAADEALVVVRMNKTHRESAEKAMRLLHAVNVKVVGVVLTHQKYYIPDYLYRYS